MFVDGERVKDVTAQKGDPKTFAFWPSVPLGRGLIDLPEVLARLDDAKFDGLLALEIDYLAPAYVADGEEAAVGASLAYLRKALAALPARH